MHDRIPKLIVNCQPAQHCSSTLISEVLRGFITIRPQIFKRIVSMHATANLLRRIHIDSQLVMVGRFVPQYRFRQGFDSTSFLVSNGYCGVVYDR